MKSFLKIIIKVSISIALLIFLFNRIDLKKTFFCIHSMDPLYFLCAILLFVFVVFLCLVRWIILLKTLKCELSLARIFISFSGGLFFNVFLPSSIGGDIVRTADLSAHTKDMSSIFATVFFDRLTGFLGLVVIAFFGFFYGYFLGLIYDFKIFLFILIFTAILVSIFFVIFSKRVFDLINKILIFKFMRDFLVKFHNSCYSFRFKKIALIKTILISVLLQGCYAIVFYFVGMSLGIKLSVIHYFIFIPIVSTITILPISIGGLGLRDNAAVVLFSALGIAADKIVAMTLINFAFLFFIGIIGGIIYGAAIYSRRL